jgi:hypothetical protein
LRLDQEKFRDIMIKPSITGGKDSGSMLKPWITLAVMAAALALTGCDDNPRKEVSAEDICSGYKAQLDGVMKDPKMTDQDRINMIPRLSGYSACKDSVGTGGLTIGTAPAGPGPAQNAEIQRRGGTSGS